MMDILGDFLVFYQMVSSSESLSTDPSFIGIEYVILNMVERKVCFSSQPCFTLMSHE